MLAGDSFLHLTRPLGPTVLGLQSSTAPLNVTIHNSAIFSVLDHWQRREAKNNNRVIGTLLGSRSEDGNEIEIRNSYAVGHDVLSDQIMVDLEHHHAMLDLHLKANPKEILVGWYATSPEFDTFSALIQNHYSGQGDGTFPHPAVHLTFKIEPGSDIDIKSYVSAPIGTTAERANDSALFIPIPYKLRQDPIDRAALELLGSAKDREDRTTYVNTDVEGLEKSITQTLELLDRVEGYVGAVVEEQVKPNQVLGEFLQNTVVMIPKVDPAEMERSFNDNVQDLLMIAYLTNIIRTQVDLSTRLATAALAMGADGSLLGTNNTGDAATRGNRANRGDRRGGTTRGG